MYVYILYILDLHAPTDDAFVTQVVATAAVFVEEFKQ